MIPHSITNFEIKKVLSKKAWFNGAYLRNNLPKLMVRLI